MVAPREKMSAFLRSGIPPNSSTSWRSSGAMYLESPSMISSPLARQLSLERPRSASLYFFVNEYKMFSNKLIKTSS